MQEIISRLWKLPDARGLSVPASIHSGIPPWPAGRDWFAEQMIHGAQSKSHLWSQSYQACFRQMYPHQAVLFSSFVFQGIGAIERDPYWWNSSPMCSMESWKIGITVTVACCNEKCGSPCQTFDPDDDPDEYYTFINQDEDLYGIANFICTCCKKIFCEQAECHLKEFCQDCEHRLCIDCSPTYYLHCEVCKESTCIVCGSDYDLCPTSVVRCCKGLNWQNCVPQLHCSGCEQEDCGHFRSKSCPECRVKCELCYEDFCSEHCEERYFNCCDCASF